jgi:tRNA nucleotidyltransferase/poly(A) polymerase
MAEAWWDSWLAELPLRRRVLDLVRASGQRAYLVGGTVRDALLGRPSCDLDLAIVGAAMPLARQVADRLYGAYVPLDAARDVARVVVTVAGAQQHIDFAALRAADIIGDLCARDYTVNAMGVALDDPTGALLDPTGGRADLAARRLRVVRAEAFHDDPLRILRGVRQSGTLGFQLTEETMALARAHLPELRRVSAERIRDELAQILAPEEAAPVLALAGELGALETLFPALGEGRWRAGARVVAALGVALVTPRLAPYRAALAQHLAEEITFGRARSVAFKLAALLSALPGGVAAARQIAQHLRLSAAEVRLVGAALGGSAWVRAQTVAPAPLDIYRYYRTAGVEGALLAVAQTITAGEDVTHCGEAAAALLRGWFAEHDTVADPPALLSGSEVIATLGLTPGPAVKEAIGRLREAQVQGLVRTRADAVAYLLARATDEPL